MGRPTSLTPLVRKRVVAAIEAGNYIETAAAYAGLSKMTIYNWMRRGRAGERPFEAFVDAVEHALAISEMRDLQVVDNAAQDGSWQAATWRLERRFPARWRARNEEPDLISEEEDIDLAEVEDLRALDEELGRRLGIAETI
jgi:hypothetical protein